MRRTQKLGIVTVLLAAGIALSGCSGQSEPVATLDLEEGLSLSPASNEVYECLTGKGWDVNLTWDGGIESDSQSVPSGQEDQYRADKDECWGKINDRILNMKSDDIAAVYRAELKTRDCLIELGYEVDTPPSEQEYIDTFQGNRWSAYGASDAAGPGASDEQWREVNTSCPQPAWSLGAS